MCRFRKTAGIEPTGHTPLFLNIQNTFLIGSAVSSDEVSAFLRTLIPLANITPLSLCTKLAGKTPDLLSQMFAEQNPEFIRAMIKAIPGWKYNGNANIYRIHGKYDHVIKCKEASVTLNGGHLIAITHANECLKAIMEISNKGMSYNES
ncbi:MAG: hypothetical protein HQL32_14340 [Planctomycetes bacterium]|nr:hypothetical protein [Planctomycetota bacterium]